MKILVGAIGIQRLILLMLFGLLQLDLSAQLEAEFNYNGRVNSGGQPFDGTGKFKFAIVNQDGDVTFWSNDSTSAAGSEPTSHVLVSVLNGFFSVNIGSSEDGMDSLVASIFQENRKLYLRVWFSDGVNPFELLTPDRRIVNPQLIGIESTSDYTIYVDALNGDDDNNGLTAATAKQTIQAGVDLLPDKIKSNITVKIFPGVYRERVNIFGIAVQPDKTLKLLGDETWDYSSPGSPNALITGADNDLTSTPVRTYGILMQNCSNIRLEGLHINYHTQDGLQINGCTEMKVHRLKCTNNTGIGMLFVNCRVILTNCISSNNFAGISCGDGSFGFTNLITNNNAHSGVGTANATISAYDVVANNNGIWGWIVETGGLANMHDTLQFNNNSDVGMLVFRGGFANFRDVTSGQMNSNANYGLSVQVNGFTQKHTNVSFSGNGTAATHTATGGALYP